MAGDPVRDAFRAELASIVSGASIAWAIKDVENVYATADGATNFIALEFAGGDERMASLGNPGNDYWDERAAVFIRLVAPLNSGRATLEDYANTIRLAFRNRTFATAGGQRIRTNSGPPEGGPVGARWIATVSVAYRTQPRG